MEFDKGQQKALGRVARWFKHDTKTKPFFYLAGYAGTGKTTIAKYFAQYVEGTVMYAAFTGKAALNMAKNGCDGASTIHSLIYTPKVHKDGTVEFRLNRESPLVDAALLVIDECSMVDNKIGRDLLQFGVPIVVLGDPAQLPPVDGAGFFTNHEPDAMLTDIHRQALDNPIIQLATLVRQGGRPKIGQYGDSVVTNQLSSQDLIEYDQILVGTNKTRQAINNKVRKLKGFDTEMPQANDKLICLRNDNQLGIFNGGMFDMVRYVEYNSKNYFKAKLSSHDFENFTTIAKIHRGHFHSDFNLPKDHLLSGSQRFDYGYAITTHKSQGSQFPKVLIYDESFVFRDDSSKWLYTAITRAQDGIKLYYK